MCLEARTIASRARESGRQERNSSALGIQAHLPPSGGQPCSAFSVVGIRWFWSTASVLSSFGHWMSTSFCGTPHPCARRTHWVLGSQSGHVLGADQSDTPSVVIAIGSEVGISPIWRQGKAMRPLRGLLGSRQWSFPSELEFGMKWGHD